MDLGLQPLSPLWKLVYRDTFVEPEVGLYSSSTDGDIPVLELGPQTDSCGGYEEQCAPWMVLSLFKSGTRDEILDDNWPRLYIWW